MSSITYISKYITGNIISKYEKFIFYLQKTIAIRFTICYCIISSWETATWMVNVYQFTKDH